MLPEGWREVTLGEVIPDYAKNKKITSSELSDDTWVLELEDIEKHSSKLLTQLHHINIKNYTKTPYFLIQNP